MLKDKKMKEGQQSRDKFGGVQKSKNQKIKKSKIPEIQYPKIPKPNILQLK